MFSVYIQPPKGKHLRRNFRGRMKGDLQERYQTEGVAWLTAPNRHGLSWAARRSALVTPCVGYTWSFGPPSSGLARGLWNLARGEKIAPGNHSNGGGRRAQPGSQHRLVTDYVGPRADPRLPQHVPSTGSMAPCMCPRDQQASCAEIHVDGGARRGPGAGQEGTGGRCSAHDVHSAVLKRRQPGEGYEARVSFAAWLPRRPTNQSGDVLPDRRRGEDKAGWQKRQRADRQRAVTLHRACAAFASCRELGGLGLQVVGPLLPNLGP